MVARARGGRDTLAERSPATAVTVRLISTRSGPGGGTWSFQEALFLGQAPDGGLFVPASLPHPPRDRFHPGTLAGLTFTERSLLAARHLLGSEIAEDVLRAVIHDALDFPVPLREIEPGAHMLELFHVPTHAFKDVGARFMARMMSALRDDHAPPVTILAATSGDTGGAVAHAFFRVPGIRVVVLFPLGKVSPRQEAQFATLGGNVTAVAVRGAFDDCQQLVRAAFADPALNARLALTSANSINIGRLLPQTFYHLHAWAELAHTAARREPVFSVPSGNFGNLTAGLIAQRALGMSLARFVAATNDNSVVPEYLARGDYRPRPSVATLSSAMDVGNPSNFQRILHLFGEAPPFTASSWTDHETRACIRDLWDRRGIAIDPHTAVGLLGLRDEMRRCGPDAQGVVLATAHPAKFAETVEPLIGRELPVPRGIASVMDRPRRWSRSTPNWGRCGRCWMERERRACGSVTRDGVAAKCPGHLLRCKLQLS